MMVGEINYVVGFSGSASSRAAVDVAHAQGLKNEATLYIVNVTKVSSTVCPAGDSIPALQCLISQAAEESSKLRDELISSLGSEGCLWHFCPQHGGVVYQLTRLATELNADIIFVGTPRRLLTIAGISAPQQISRTSKVPVRVVPS